MLKYFISSNVFTGVINCENYSLVRSWISVNANRQLTTSACIEHADPKALSII